MRHPRQAIAYSLLFAVVLAQPVTADNLVQDGDFSEITYSGSAPLTTLYGQFGTETGSTLTAADWSTSGYNFVYAPGTADAGTGSGANTSQPNEAPGQYNTTGGYGSTYLWGANNGGAATLPSTDPGLGNYIGADGAYEVGAITQTINGLTIGNTYALTFYWAGAQQQGTKYTSATTDYWTASLGSQSFTTPTANVPSKGFSGWMQQTFDYTATSASETLSFLATGTPSGQPPFSLLGGVTLGTVPEPSAWMYLAGFGTVGTLLGAVRRRRRSSLALGDKSG